MDYIQSFYLKKMDVATTVYKSTMGYIEGKLYNMFENIHCKNKTNHF